MITWKLWTTLPEVKLWEAVALVLEIEPTDLKPSKDRLLVERSRWPVFASHSFPSQQKETDFHKALSFAERAANVAGPIYLRTYLGSGMNKLTAPVSLAEVVAFFVGVDWPDIPAPLLALVPEVAEPGPIAAASAQSAETAAPVVDLSMLARRDQLIAAFGRFTGMDRTWFDKLKDTPALLAARRVEGVGARGRTKEPLFCPFEVMVWLADKRRKKGRQFHDEDKPWKLLEEHFRAVYEAHSRDDPRQYPPG